MLCSLKAPFPRISGVGSFTLHNDHYPQINDIRGFEAYFLAVCEIKVVYNKTGSEKPVISAFLFLAISGISKISQSLCASFWSIILLNILYKRIIVQKRSTPNLRNGPFFLIRTLRKDISMKRTYTSSIIAPLTMSNYFCTYSSTLE